MSHKITVRFGAIPELDLGRGPAYNNCNVRAARADAALRAHQATQGGGDTAYDYVEVAELLADLRHWCDRQSVGYTEAERLAYRHYIEELNGE